MPFYVPACVYMSQPPFLSIGTFGTEPFLAHRSFLRELIFAFLCLCSFLSNKTKVHVQNTQFWPTRSCPAAEMKMGDAAQQMPQRIFNPNPLIKVFSS